MKFLFIVQGDGRGHMTQAIALKKILENNNHQVSEVLIGLSPLREVPEFFVKKIGTQITGFDSPNFSPSAQNKRPSIIVSTVKALPNAMRYFKSIRNIKNRIYQNQPDVVVNFYDMLGGMTYWVYDIKTPMVCVAHQYLMEHPAFEFPPGKKRLAGWVRLMNYLTSSKASLKLALSLEPLGSFPQRRMIVVPPLLREEALKLPSVKEDFILGYMVNPGFSEEVVNWHKNHPEEQAHFFWDKKDAISPLKLNDQLTFHKINDTLFLDLLSRCRAFASTGGFESICEAMYLGKPVMMVPAHIEQECNAHDAARMGAGIVSDTFAIEKLTRYAEQYAPNKEFRKWVREAEPLFVHYLIREGYSSQNLSREPALFKWLRSLFSGNISNRPLWT